MIGKNRISGLLILACLICMPDNPVEAKTYRIISVQHQSMLPYDNAFTAFETTLKSMGMQTEIVRYNAESDLTALDAKVLEIKESDAFDLILSLGTHATKRLVKQVKKTPIVFTGLGDPENSGVIPKDEKEEPMWESSGANYTGVETPAYVSLGIRVMRQLVDFKNIGMIYLAGSPSHEAAIKQVEKLAKELNCGFFHQGFPLRDDQGKRYPTEVIRNNISESLEKVLPKVDVFFVQISKSFDDNFDLFREAFLKNKKFSAGDPLYIKKGIVMGVGRNFKVFGKQCGEYAARILKGEKPSQLPMNVGSEISIELNLMAASLVGYNPSVDLVGAADMIHDKIETK